MPHGGATAVTDETAVTGGPTAVDVPAAARALAMWSCAAVEGGCATKELSPGGGERSASIHAPSSTGATAAAADTVSAADLGCGGLVASVAAGSGIVVTATGAAVMPPASTAEANRPWAYVKYQ